MQVKFVKTPRDETPSEGIDLDKVSEIVSEQIATTALVVVGTISAVKVVDTLCKIAINLTNPASWR
jgi:hypothetical protein